MSNYHKFLQYKLQKQWISKGTATILFQSVQSVQKALDLDGALFNGRHIRVTTCKQDRQYSVEELRSRRDKMEKSRLFRKMVQEKELQALREFENNPNCASAVSHQLKKSIAFLNASSQASASISTGSGNIKNRDHDASGKTRNHNHHNHNMNDNDSITVHTDGDKCNDDENGKLRSSSSHKSFNNINTTSNQNGRDGSIANVNAGHKRKRDQDTLQDTFDNNDGKNRQASNPKQSTTFITSNLRAQSTKLNVNMQFVDQPVVQLNYGIDDD
jgi:hypothetical protein